MTPKNPISKSPDTIDELLEGWKSDDAENLRVTLLYKDQERTYFFLSEGVAELNPGREITAGIFLALTPKKTIAEVVHNAVFLERKTTNGYYFVVTHKEISEEIHLLPFKYVTRRLPSVILNKALEERVYMNICDVEQEKIAAIEKIGEEGLIRAYVRERICRRFKKRSNELAAEARRIHSDIAKLFEEFSCPSVMLTQSERFEEDYRTKTLFVQEILIKRIQTAGIFLVLCLVPYSPVIEKIKDDNANYELRFGEKANDEKKRLIGEFFMEHPRAAKGMKAVYECMKHASNVLAFGVGAGVSYLGYKYAHPIVSYPLMCASTLSAAQMFWNVVQSKGHDSSGIISSYFERKLTTRLE